MLYAWYECLRKIGVLSYCTLDWDAEYRKIVLTFLLRTLDLLCPVAQFVPKKPPEHHCSGGFG